MASMDVYKEGHLKGQLSQILVSPPKVSKQTHRCGTRSGDEAK